MHNASNRRRVSVTLTAQTSVVQKQVQGLLGPLLDPRSPGGEVPLLNLALGAPSTVVRAGRMKGMELN